MRGGSLESFRQEQSGHGIPLNQRFGGWYLTGTGKFTNHLANFFGSLSPQGIQRQYLQPGVAFNFDRYLAPHSDVLPQLVHEHQVGFVNRAVEASYRTRTALADGQGKLTPADAAMLEKQARGLARYLLFADEAPLPPGGLPGDEDFKRDYTSVRRLGPGGASLKDFDLRIVQDARGVKLEVDNAPAIAFVDGEMIQGVKEHLFAVLRDFVYIANEVVESNRFDLADGSGNALLVFDAILGGVFGELRDVGSGDERGEGGRGNSLGFGSAARKCLCRGHGCVIR